MNKFTLSNLCHLSPHFWLLSFTSMGLLISPILTFNALANIEILIDPYNDSGVNNAPLPINNNIPAPVTNSQQLPPVNNQQLPSGNQNNVMGEVFINGNPTPNRPQVVSGNVIKSNQILPQIPPLSEPYRAPNNNQDEVIEGNNSLLSVSSASPFEQTPINNVTTLDQKLINNSSSNTVRSIDLSPNTISSANNIGTRRTLNDILGLSEPTQTPTNSSSNAPTIAASSSTTSQLYKVLVTVNNPNQESQVKYLYPEAFRTVFNGRSMLQVGVFSSINKADDVARNLQNRGLNTEIAN